MFPRWGMPPAEADPAGRSHATAAWKAGNVPYQVQVKDVPPQPVLSVRDRVPVMSLWLFDDACADMYAYVEQTGARRAGTTLSLWHSAPSDVPGEGEIETCVPVDLPVLARGRITFSELPASKLTRTVHHGPYDGMEAAFDAVWTWIERNHRQAAGPPLDVILVGPGDTDNPKEYQTEIAWPIH